MIHLSKIVVGKEEIKAVVDVLKSGQLAQGEKVKELEEKFAGRCGTKYAIAVNNGTAALHTALYAIGIKPGDEVITTPFTFVATANAILMLGARPVFVDIDEKNYNLDPNLIEKSITNKTRAIIVVNLYGLPADYNKINLIAKKHNLLVIEDAAQSINSSYAGKKSGNLADISCFSFYATKNIMSGEGGMITTNIKKYYMRAQMFRHHGQSSNKRYEYSDLGYNYRMTDFVAALAISQLSKLDSITGKRRHNAEIYNQAFKKIPGIFLTYFGKKYTHVYHQYVLGFHGYKLSRNQVKKLLEKKGIDCNIHYPTPLYDFKHLNNGRVNRINFPVTEQAAREVLSIPVHPYLTKKEINYIIRTILL